MTGTSIGAFGLGRGMVLRHFKGGVYQVLGECWLATTGGQNLAGPYVRYVKLADADGKFVNSGVEYLRALQEFQDRVEWPNGLIGPRFIPITNCPTWPPQILADY